MSDPVKPPAKSEVKEETCDSCMESGQVCAACSEPSDDCTCGFRAQDLVECDDCDGTGFVNVERCVTCKQVVDNCNCEGS